jgi:prepilin-type N-terminal cleavage/methylation domain-containing protein
MKTQKGFSLIEMMIALSLSALLCAGIFNLFNTMDILYRRQIAIVTLQDNMRFLSLFLSKKIRMAGDWSCLSQAHAPRSIVILRYTADEAYDHLGLTIKSKTNLLQLQECVRLHGHKRYLPIKLFVADTFRLSKAHHKIYALFYKIAHHPREELVTNMTDFRVRVYHVAHAKKNIRAIKINYELTSYAMDQNGVLYVARRNAK